MAKILSFVALLLMAVAVAPSSAQQADSPAITVFAAASLTDVLPKVAAAWKEQGGSEVTFSFDATSRLAKQIEAGAPADLFFSADEEWMDYAAQKSLIDATTRLKLLGNELVVIVPRDSAHIPESPQQLNGDWLVHLALAGEAVPAGKYAFAALTSVGVWDELQDKVVRGDNVRMALEYVARGEAEAGIVYRTDATSNPKVKVAFAFPAGTHPEIVYPAAMVKGISHPREAKAFLAFCQGPEAKAIFEAADFKVVVSVPPLK